LLAPRTQQCSSCRSEGCPLRDTRATMRRQSAAGRVYTSCGNRLWTKPPIHVAAAVALLPGVDICQATMPSTGRGSSPRCGPAVGLPPTSFNDSDGVGSRLRRIACFASKA
jgi:hypothetical protein